MKIFLSTMLALLGISTSLHANLGDTETQIQRRYGIIQGAPVGETNRDITETFIYKNYVIVVKFLDGTSQRESFTRKDSKAISDQELQALLAANANGGKWVLMDDNKNVKIWVLESHEEFAGYYKEKPYFSVQTSDMLAFEQAVKIARERQPQAKP